MQTSSPQPLKSETKLSIIIPVYNQEKWVSASLSRISEVLDSTLLEYEIVVVNDGSTDRTFDVLKKEQEQDSKIHVISYPANRGKGYAVREGVMRSKGSTVIFTDGDLDVSPEVIKDYIDELGSFDLVVASKRHPLSRVKAPSSRKFLSRAFSVVVRLLVGIKLKDTQAGLKVGNGDALRLIFSVMQVRRYAFDVELFVIADLLQLKIKEMPIEIELDRRFKFRDIVRMFVDVSGIAYRHRVRHRYREQIKGLK